MLTNPWILLRLRVRPSGIWAEVEDDEGRRFSCRRPLRWEWRSVPLGSPDPVSPFLLPPPRVDLFLPKALDGMLAQKAGRLRSLPANPASQLPAPLPVFVHTPRALAAFSWEPVISRILPGDVQVIRLARPRGAWKERWPFRLPLRVHAVGREAERYLDKFWNHEWMAAEDVWTFGLQVGVSRVRDLDRSPAPHVLVCGASRASGTLRRVARIQDVESRPRLVLVVSSATPEIDGLLASLYRPADGTSVLWLPVPPGLEGERVDKLLYNILHDQPLHEAVRRASAPGDPLGAPLLISDPAGVEDLRMADTLEELSEESAELEARVLPGDVSSFLLRALPDCPPRLESALWTLDSLAKPAREAVGRVNDLEIDFGRETTSMVPIAESHGALARARERESEIRAMLRAISADGESREAIAKHQERRVDVALRRLDRSTFSRPWVKPDETLRRGARYRVRVHIGRPLRLSLVTGEVPALDPLLPELPDEGSHLLHVALYGLDFKVASKNLRALRLPPLGGSDPVSFDVYAPWQTGEARLRIAVYYDLPAGFTAEDRQEPAYHNHLIQSFLLETLVEDEERMHVPDGTRVRLEFSQTERFANLPDLTPRILSIGLNDGPGGATHTVMAKRGAVTEEIHLGEVVLGTRLSQVRERLDAATWNDTREKGRFPIGKAGPQREADFDRTVRDLARAGKELYDFIWQNASSTFQDALYDVREEVDKVVQIVRFGQNYLFPWSVFYDFPVPPQIAGAPKPQVCQGFRRTNPDGSPFSCKQCLSNCLHPDKEEAFCVYGFWGTRHQVEQLLHTPFKREESISRLAPVRDGAVRVGVGLQGGLGAKLPGSLAQRVGAQWVRELTAAEDVLDELWTDDRRPAILVLLSHYETRTIAGQAPGPRLTLPGGKWLQPKDLLGRAQKLPGDRRKWKEPNPVILLAACESAGADLGSLATFLGAFADSRAAAVVGTEVVVFEGIASRFGEEVAADLLDGKSLGEAIVRFRRSLLQQLNPLGLVFTPYGSADLARPKETPHASTPSP